MTPPPPSCPMHRGGLLSRNSNSNNQQKWWPEQLDVSILRRNEGLAWAPAAVVATTNASNHRRSEAEEYARRFAQLDLAAVERDLHQLMTSSVDWWPADYGHYGPFFIRYVALFGCC